MSKVIRLWVIWIGALVAGVYGTALVYQGIFGGQSSDLWYGTPTLLLGIWVTGNIWASARQSYRANRQRA